MEGKKQTGSSSSSFTSDLFGSKEYSPSSMGIFGSIFAPASPKVLGRESLRSEVAEKKQDSADDAWNTKSGTPASDLTSKMNEGESQSIPNKDMSSIYQEQRVQPCHLSSSIYYGGQDIYHHPQTAHTSSMNPMARNELIETYVQTLPCMLKPAARGYKWRNLLTCSVFSLVQKGWT